MNGIDFLYDFVERRIGDQPFLVADNKLALELLDWSPRRNIKDMCTDSVRIFFKLNLFIIIYFCKEPNKKNDKQSLTNY